MIKHMWKSVGSLRLSWLSRQVPAYPHHSPRSSIHPHPPSPWHTLTPDCFTCASQAPCMSSLPGPLNSHALSPCQSHHLQAACIFSSPGSLHAFTLQALNPRCPQCPHPQAPTSPHPQAPARRYSQAPISPFKPTDARWLNNSFEVE